MPNRVAAVMALVVFAACLLIGMRAENTFATTVARALFAMAGTWVIGWIVGTMAQKMLDENLKLAEEKLKKSEMDSVANDR
jgi:hypothetical protein